MPPSAQTVVVPNHLTHRAIGASARRAEDARGAAARRARCVAVRPKPAAEEQANRLE